MEVEIFFYSGLICFLTGTALSFILPERIRNYPYIFSALGAACLTTAGVLLAAGFPFTTSFLRFASLFEFSITGDGLSGFFLIVLGLAALPVSLYSIGYTGTMKNRSAFGALFNLFLMSIVFVILSANVTTFLVSWETMSVISYFLVTFERDRASTKAGLVYAVMTHIGTAFIIVLFLILYKYTGSMVFDEMRSRFHLLPANLKPVLFFCALIGFGTKAGLVPLHSWLPIAHPAAPSNVSALMSGVMIKTGVYGFVRFCIGMGGGSWPEWCGIAVIAVGGISAFIGILYALTEKDLKRTLAYSSVENMGIIFLGLGACLLFSADRLNSYAGLALSAALFHCLNHSLFKSLLFMGAGAVVHATGTKNIEEMGGLIKGMPCTALFFLTGAVSICAFPPLNGFASEWLTYQSLLLGFKASSIASKIASPLGGAALALAGALAAACFVKVFGIAFLGMPRSEKASGAQEHSLPMTVGMALPAALCVLFGLFPGMGLMLGDRAVWNIAGEPAVTGGGAFLSIGATLSSISPLALAFSLLLLSFSAGLFIYLVGGSRKTTLAASWDCGMRSLTPRMQYTATAFTKPLRIIFKRVYLPRREVKISYEVKNLFVRSIVYSGEITPFVDEHLFKPALATVHRIAEKTRMIQSGSLQLYLAYILVTLIVLLIFGM